jgi:hypothetical protein
LGRRSIAIATTATTTVAATATATATAVAATAAAATTAGLVLSLIHTQWSATHIVAIEVLDRARSVRLTHLHEAEAARATGFSVSRQRHGFNGAMLCEQRSNVRLAGTEG